MILKPLDIAINAALIKKAVADALPAAIDQHGHKTLADLAVTIKGDKGDQGDIGPKGDKGDVGPKGDKGDTGREGPKGDKGDQGPIGPKGDKGEPGQSIKGDKGDPGLKGTGVRDAFVDPDDGRLYIELTDSRTIDAGVVKGKDGKDGKPGKNGYGGGFVQSSGGSLPAGGTTGQVLTKNSDATGDASWQTVSGGGGSTAWGGITGTLSAQTDLQTALNGKSDTGHTHTASQISDSTVAGRAILTAADAAAQRTALGLVIGTNVQAQDAELSAIAGLVSAADRLPYFTGSGTAALATFTAAGRALVDDADAAAQRTTLGLAAVASSGSASDLSAGTLPAARFDDTAHGARAGGTLHAAATTSVAGFMSSADKTKLDGVATGATANATDAALRARTSHTGDDLTGAFGIADSTDQTKRVAFDASNITTGTTRTLTLPNNSGQILITAGAQTVSGVKTFSVPPVLATPTTAQASVNLPHGTAPTTPANGDMWTTTGGVFARVNGATVQLDAAGGGVSDGDKGDVVVSSGGATWTIDSAYTSAVQSRANHTGTQAQSTITNLTTDLAAKAPLASPTFTGTVTLPAGQVVNGVTLTNAGGTTNFLRADGVYAAPPAGGVTDLGYTASTRLLTSSTGADVTLPLVTSTDAGLAPASGGGTTNFLRADGTWAAPAGGGGPIVIAAAPATDQADWAPAGFGTGASTIKAQPTTNSFIGGLVGGTADQQVRLINDSAFVIMLISEDANSTAANRLSFGRGSYILIPGETIDLRYSGTSSRWVKASVSRDLFEVDNLTQLTLPQSGTAVQNMGTGSTAILPTASTINSSATPTNDFDEYSRTQITNATAAGGASIRGAQAWVFRGATAGRQGFLHTARVRFTAQSATGGVWAGLANTTASTLTLPSAFLNCLFLAADAGQTTLRIMRNDGSGTATAIDLGANFPVPSATAAYEYLFYSQPGGTQVEYMVRRLDSRQVAQGSLTTDLPAATTALNPWLGLFVGATAAATTAQMNYMLTVGL